MPTVCVLVFDYSIKWSCLLQIQSLWLCNQIDWLKIRDESIELNLRFINKRHTSIFMKLAHANVQCTVHIDSTIYILCSDRFMYTSEWMAMHFAKGKSIRYNLSFYEEHQVLVEFTAHRLRIFWVHGVGWLFTRIESLLTLMLKRDYLTVFVLIICDIHISLYLDLFISISFSYPLCDSFGWFYRLLIWFSVSESLFANWMSCVHP